MRKNNFIFVLLFFSALLVALIFYILQPTFKAPSALEQITIGENIFAVEIADTNDERAKGLSGREFLPENTGMLFIFEEPNKTGFWMKDMKFAIDIIWIRDGQVIGFTEDVKPEFGTLDERLTMYYPPSPIDMVFEVIAGTVKNKNISVGDVVLLHNIMHAR